MAQGQTREEKLPRQNVKFFNEGMSKKIIISPIAGMPQGPGGNLQLAKRMLPKSFSSEERTNQKAKEQDLFN